MLHPLSQLDAKLLILLNANTLFKNTFWIRLCAFLNDVAASRFLPHQCLNDYV